MPLSIVAVVGRPNVGKSTFVNRIAERQDAIVHESSGVTRDRSYNKVDWNGRDFILIDTGGLELTEAAKKNDGFQTSINKQVVAAAEEADCVIFIVDSKVGITNDDKEIAHLLRQMKLKVFLVANKSDDPSNEGALWEFLELGFGDAFPVSSIHGHGTGDLLDLVVEALSQEQEQTQASVSQASASQEQANVSQTSVSQPQTTLTDSDTDEYINIAIIGRPNAGKSTLTNHLAGKNRSIVSDIAGTTRDAIDVIVTHDEALYRIVDTAGIRKKSSITEDVEYYGFVRALRAIDRADVALLLVDATLGLTDIDQRVAGLAKERDCALIILLNKWDLIDDAEKREEIKERVQDRMSFVSYAPIIPISAQTGRSVHRIWKAINTAFENFKREISTSKLNDFIMDIREFGHTAVKGSKRLKLNFATQVATAPPSFTFFANVPEIIDDSYLRFLEGRMRSNFDFEGTPIKIKFKRKVEK
jgi:GTP-binding protein